MSDPAEASAAEVAANNPRLAVPLVMAMFG
jgi:hypothetical protein